MAHDYVSSSFCLMSLRPPSWLDVPNLRMSLSLGFQSFHQMSPIHSRDCSSLSNCALPCPLTSLKDNHFWWPVLTWAHHVFLRANCMLPALELGPVKICLFWHPMAKQLMLFIPKPYSESKQNNVQISTFCIIAVCLSFWLWTHFFLFSFSFFFFLSGYPPWRAGWGVGVS